MNLCVPIFAEAIEGGTRWQCANCPFSDVDSAGHFPDRISRRCKGHPVPRPASYVGPGTHLHALLKARGYEPAERCRCQSRMRYMDDAGPEWCAENVETIVGWMREAAKERGLLFVAPGARWLVKRAVRAATR